MSDTDRDPWLTSTEAAERAGIQARTFRKYVDMELAPPPDDPDADRPANRRIYRWRTSTIDHWMANRVGQGRRRDLVNGKRPVKIAGAERIAEWPG